MINDPEVTDSQEWKDIVDVIAAYNALIDKADLCCNATIDNKHFARLEITNSGHLQVGWPELRNHDYYGGADIEAQSERIEPTLFVKSVEEIVAMNNEMERLRTEAERKKYARYVALQFELDKSNERAERALLAKLRKKYPEGAS